MTRTALIALALAATPLGAAAAANETANEPIAASLNVPASVIPAQLKPAEQIQYRAVFAAIRAGNWADATQRLDAMPDGLLTPFARAELILAKGSPRADSTMLAGLLARAPEMPQAQQLARVLSSRGERAGIELPVLQDLVSLPGASKRASARTTRSDAVASVLGPQLTKLIKDNQPTEAEALLATREAELTVEARTEWRQRIAWCWYRMGDDVNARRIADPARQGGGEWKVHADWVAGLAAWRQQDWAAAATAFNAVAIEGRDYELRAAGLFWAARADTAGGRPDRVEGRLRNAARLPETFYGMLASGMLGVDLPPVDARPGPLALEWRETSRLPNVRVAAALAEIEEDALASSVLRHQARIGAAGDHASLLHLATGLGLPSTQIWLAQHGPAGTAMPASARYPIPAWTPARGWRVDPSLIYAHALQESQFRVDAVSSSGAIGLMQIMPTTAQQIAKKKGETIDRSQLTKPAVAFEYGQSYLEMLRDMASTQGLLPKIIAAYNAGPGSVLNWNDTVRDQGDPLLFIESIPYNETRGYVAIVLRNYWMYQREKGQKLSSMKAMAQGLWPRFPGLPGKTALRLDTDGTTTDAD